MDEAKDILDENGIPYGVDGYGRIMINDIFADDAVDAWDEADIEYDEI